MKNGLIIVAFVALFLSARMLLNAPHALAAEKTVSGTITAEKDDGKLKTVILKTEDGTVYNITLDDKGKKLGDMNGKKATVTGDHAEKEERHWITVTESKVEE